VVSEPDVSLLMANRAGWSHSCWWGRGRDWRKVWLGFLGDFSLQTQPRWFWAHLLWRRGGTRAIWKDALHNTCCCLSRWSWMCRAPVV